MGDKESRCLESWGLGKSGPLTRSKGKEMHLQRRSPTTLPSQMIELQLSFSSTQEGGVENPNSWYSVAQALKQMCCTKCSEIIKSKCWASGISLQIKRYLPLPNHTKIYHWVTWYLVHFFFNKLIRRVTDTVQSPGTQKKTKHTFFIYLAVVKETVDNRSPVRRRCKSTLNQQFFLAPAPW